MENERIYPTASDEFAAVLTNPHKMLVLWAIESAFCTSAHDFFIQFGEDLHAPELISELKDLGLIGEYPPRKRTGPAAPSKLVLTRLGKRFVRGLAAIGPPTEIAHDILDQPQPSRNVAMTKPQRLRQERVGAAQLPSLTELAEVRGSTWLSAALRHFRSSRSLGMGEFVQRFAGTDFAMSPEFYIEVEADVLFPADIEPFIATLQEALQLTSTEMLQLVAAIAYEMLRSELGQDLAETLFGATLAQMSRGL